MLLTLKEMHFLSTVLEQDAEGNDIAKQDLTVEERKRLLDLDEGIFMCEGKHMIKNYDEIKDELRPVKQTMI